MDEKPVKKVPLPPSRLPPDIPKKVPKKTVPVALAKPPKERIIIQKEKVYINTDIPILPPSAIELEKAVIGAYMIGSNDAHEHTYLLKHFMFHDLSHQVIFKAIERLVSEEMRVDLLTVSDTLRKMGQLDYCGGEFYLIQLSNMVSTTSHIEFHIRIILQKYMLREIISNCRNVMHKALHLDPDVFQLIESIEANISRITSVSVRKLDVNETLDPAIELMQKVKRVRAGESPGIFTGVSEFDDWCGGFQPRELITIAARPGMGKTTVGLAICATAVFDKGMKVIFFSLEMSAVDLKYRLAARLTGINYSKIRKALLTDEELKNIKQALKEIEESNLVILDTSVHKNKLENILAEAAKLVSQGYQMAFLDYVQLIKLGKSSGDRTSDLSTITRELKACANELNIPIVEFAQLSRGVDSRPGQMPVLADLKQSGSIEEDSDTVIFILRPAYYREQDNSGLELPQRISGDTKFIVAKGRNIGTRSFRTFIDFMKYSFVSYSDSGY